jgi:hypothetical protein
MHSMLMSCSDEDHALSNQKNYFATTTSKKVTTTTGKNSHPEVLKDDLIYDSRSAFVIPEYKLIFFTFPKVACSEWKRMFMRIDGNPIWCKTRGINAHNPTLNKLGVLGDYDPEVATAMMTSPAWTKAAIVREPKERVLSAFLDKSVKEGHYFTKKCCKNLAEGDEQTCIENLKDFKSFLHFVTKYPKECFDVHWEPQVAKIDAKWWPYLDFIGYQNTLLDDSKKLMQMLTSTRDTVQGRTLYDRYGSSGWGSEQGCENRPHAFLEENTSAHNLNTGSKLKEWYTPETEKIVEQYWAVEWKQENIKFEKVQLFPKNE